jgi:hypothetical protein
MSRRAPINFPRLALVAVVAPTMAATAATRTATAPATRPATVATPPGVSTPVAKSGPAAPTPEGLPTQADVQTAFDTKDYPAVLQKLQRLLILKGKAAESYDRHALLALKAETHLRMKAGGPAAQAFAEAAKIAPDGPAAAADIAAELLVRRSGAGLAYQPKLKDPADKTKAQPPIDVVDPDSRKKAVAALFADEWAAVEPRVRAAGQARTLELVIEVLPAARNLRWLEMAATGKDDRTRELAAPVATKAKGTIESFLKESAEAVEPIEVTAGQITTARVPKTDKASGKILGFVIKYRRMGPTPRQFATLRDVFAASTKVRDACDELGGTLGATGHEFNEAKGKADQLRLRAGTLLDTDWSIKYDQPPVAPKPAGT